jgi:hypothetical protein
MGLLDKLQSKHKEKYEKEKIEAKFNKELNEASLKDIRTKMGKLAKKGRSPQGNKSTPRRTPPDSILLRVPATRP